MRPYQVKDGTLVQTISPSARTAYPVVADPKVTSTWWNHTVYFNKSETLKIAAGAAVAALVGQVPTVPTKVIGGIGTSMAAVAGTYLAWNKCLKIVFYAYPATPIPQPYSGSEAGGYCR